MRRRFFSVPTLLVVVLLFAAIGVFVARAIATRQSRPVSQDGVSTRGPARDTVKIVTPVVENNEFKMKTEEVKLGSGGDPVAKTLDALFAKSRAASDSAIPSGTRLIGVTVHEGLATVDLSDDFKGLDKRGDTSQSLAQQQIRAALAQFPEIKKMRVTVGGKTFEDGHSGPWDDIPVRDENASAGGGA